MSGTGTTNANGGLTLGTAGASDQEFLSGRTLNNAGAATLAGSQDHRLRPLPRRGRHVRQQAGRQPCRSPPTRRSSSNGGTPARRHLHQRGDAEQDRRHRHEHRRCGVTLNDTAAARSRPTPARSASRAVARSPTSATLTTVSGGTLDFDAGTYTGAGRRVDHGTGTA